MALRLAVEHEWGGRDSQRKADELIDDVLHWFTSKRGTRSRHNTSHHFATPQSTMRTTWRCCWKRRCRWILMLRWRMAARSKLHGSSWMCTSSASVVCPHSTYSYVIEKSLWILHPTLCTGDFSTIDRLQQQAAPPTSACGADAAAGAEDASSSSGEEDDDGSDAMDVDEPPTPVPIRQPVVDDDGFTLVQRRGRQR